MAMPTRRSLRVLILEDSDSDAALIRDHLEHAGFDVEVAGSVVEFDPVVLQEPV